MAIYRFRVTFEDYDEVIREIDVLSKHSFLDLHRAILDSVGFDPENPSSFYISNDQWKKGEEFTYLPSEMKMKKGILLMGNTRLNQYIDDPHQKFYYIYNFERPIDLHVQLIKILEEEPGKNYPSLFKSIGKAPKILNTMGGFHEGHSGAEEDSKSDFDFLNDLAYDAEEEEDIDLLDGDESQSDEFSESPDADDDF